MSGIREAFENTNILLDDKLKNPIYCSEHFHVIELEDLAIDISQHK